MFNLMDKKIMAILGKKCLLISGPMVADIIVLDAVS